MIPVRKAKKYIFEGINEQRGIYGLTELIRERGNHMKALEFRNCNLCEREFYRFDTVVLQKLKRLTVDNCRGLATADMMLRTTS